MSLRSVNIFCDEIHLTTQRVSKIELTDDSFMDLNIFSLLAKILNK